MTPKQLIQKQAELEKLRDRIRAQGKSLATERSYGGAVGKFLDFLCSEQWPPDATSKDKVERFLTAEARRDATMRYVRPRPERVPSPLEQLDLTA
jgi:hypothetical protein